MPNLSDDPTFASEHYSAEHEFSFQGKVEIKAEKGEKIEIPDGAVIEDKVGHASSEISPSEADACKQNNRLSQDASFQYRVTSGLYS